MKHCNFTNHDCPGLNKRGSRFGGEISCVSGDELLFL